MVSEGCFQVRSRQICVDAWKGEEVKQASAADSEALSCLIPEPLFDISDSEPLFDLSNFEPLYLQAGGAGSVVQGG